MTWQLLYQTYALQDGVPVDLQGDETWRNDDYIVTLRRLPGDGEHPDAMHLSIRNDDRSTRHDWRDFQRIKNQLAGPEWEAVEIYPAESRLVDMANQYHLFCFPFSLGIGFPNRLVGNQAQADIVAPGAVQRNPEPVDLQWGGLSKLKEMQRNAADYATPKPEEAP